MDKINIKKIAWFLVKIFVLYWVAGAVAFGFGKGLYLISGIDLSPCLSILHKIFFVILCVVALFWEPIQLRFLYLVHHDLNHSSSVDEPPMWQKALFFLAVVFFCYLRIFDAILAFANYYLNRGNNFYTRNYDSMSPLGMLLVLAVSVLLSILLMFLLHRSKRFQSIAPILALICGCLAVLALLLPSGEDGVMEEFVVSQISPVSLPDKDVLLWALPALALAYFGRKADLFPKQNRWAKLLSYGAIALSCTFVGDLLGLIGSYVLH